MDNRIKYIDITKGITICLVLIGHLNFPMWIINLIYFFHMPMFVIVSGILHNSTEYNQLIKTSKKIIISYLFYGFLFIGFSVFLRGYKLDYFTSLLLGRPSGIYSIKFFGIFWFTITLLSIKWIAYFLKPNLFSVFFSLMLFILIPLSSIKYSWLVNLPFAISQSLLLLVYYYLGLYYKSIKWNGIFIFIMPLFVFTFLSYYNINNYNGIAKKIINYHLLKVNQPLIAILLSISGSLVILQLSKYIENTDTWLINFIKYMGKYSFVYFSLQFFVFFVVNSIFKILSIESCPILTLICTIILISIFILFVNKFLKNTYIKKILLFV